MVTLVVPVEQSGDARALSFTRDVIPILTKAGCNSGACHGSFQGRGGFRLSLLGYDSAADYESIVKAARGRRVSPAAPEQSLILRKPAGAIPHGGGVRFSADSSGYRVIRDWITQGLGAPTSDDPRVARLEVTPNQPILALGRATQLQVHAVWSDGQRHDVTPLALYDSRDERFVEVTALGIVRATSPGKGAVTVRYAGQVAAVDVTVPYEKPQAVAEFTPANFIDEHAAAEWQRLGVAPAPTACDTEFVRRVYLDLIGTLPHPDEVRNFTQSNDPAKRTKLIDQLLDRPEYVDYWTLKWGDLLRAHRRYLGDKGLDTFQGWLRRCVRENRPLDAICRELLTAQGNLFTSGPVAFYFVDAKPEELAETTAQVFLGVRLQCARCHHHPLESWSQDDYYGLAAFFTRLEIKDSGNLGVRFGGPKTLRPTAADNPNRLPQIRRAPQLFNAPPLTTDNVADVRQHLADWITRPDNAYFARNFVNRYWAWLTGLGLFEPVDDLRATNPPSHPALVDDLARDFADHRFDVKHLLRTICGSRVYQLASERNPTRDSDGRLLTHRVPRRLPAEVLLDALNQAAGTTETFDGQPPGTRAIALPDPTVTSYFLTTFGRPVRTNACECARGSTADLSQALHMLNSAAIHNKVVQPAGRLGRLLKAGASDSEIINELYLATLARVPSDGERETVRELLADAPSREEGLQDLLWSLLNSAEFVFNH
jgi:hypothetical protein